MLNFLAWGAIAERPCHITIHKIDIDAVVRAIEVDAGDALPGLAQALTEAKAGFVGRVTTPAQILVRQARERSGLTLAAFAEHIATPVATVWDWEQGHIAPPGALLCLLRLIAKYPDLIRELAPAS